MTMKRFTKVSSEGYWKIKDKQADYKEIWDLTNPQLIEDRLNQLNEENEQLKQQLNYIQNSISEHIKHQKTELGQKALKEIIVDYNEWLLGHNGGL